MTTHTEALTSALEGQYLVDRELGSGGMATVYLAEDCKHQRQVAVKVLRPELAASIGTDRFLREIQIAARLHHPHILALYDSGEASGFLYYVMPYVEGESLRDRLNRERQLPLDDALHIAQEVADALSYAHSRNVVHRDIKPENILLEARHAVVADFGIARAISTAGGDRLTETGLVVGTPSYMSPEQAGGDEDVDGRSDLYSLGCVLYEMLAGQAPFTGPTIESVVHQHLAVEAPPITNLRPAVPSEIAGTVARALSKTPADRFSPAAQFAEALTSSLSGLSRREPRRVAKADDDQHSIVVLPFANMSPRSENEYFSDGVTEELINALTRVAGLRVAARTSAFAFKGKDQDVRDIGEALGVEYVLEGSVRHAGDRVRITAQFVKVEDGYHVWSDTFEREMKDVFAIQDEISAAIVEALKVKLIGAGEEAVSKRHTEDVEAYHAYLRGRYYWNKRTEAAVRKGLQFFRESLDSDPTYALAHVGMADSYNMLGFYRGLPPKEAFPRARAAAERALAIDATLSEAHTSRAYVAFYHEWDWEQAGRLFERAIALNPRYHVAHQWYANLLAATGRAGESLDEMSHALELDPLSLIVNAALGWLCLYARQYDRAIGHLRKTLEMDDRFEPALIWLAQAHEHEGNPEEALQLLERAVTVSDRSTEAMAALARGYATSGRDVRAREILAQLQDPSSNRYVSSFDMATVHAGLGDIPEAIDCLHTAFDERSHWMVFLEVDDRLDPLRGEPRFQSLVDRIQFPT